MSDVSRAPSYRRRELKLPRHLHQFKYSGGCTHGIDSGLKPSFVTPFPKLIYLCAGSSNIKSKSSQRMISVAA
ncbi:unnamed protein product [Aspergillus oryzae]|nr:unnamed protein product [Aspergillus oryzae]